MEMDRAKKLNKYVQQVNDTGWELRLELRRAEAMEYRSTDAKVALL